MAVAPSEGTTAGLGCSPGSGPTVRVAAPEVADSAHPQRGMPRVRHRRGGVFFRPSISCNLQTNKPSCHLAVVPLSSFSLSCRFFLCRVALSLCCAAAAVATSVPAGSPAHRTTTSVPHAQTRTYIMLGQPPQCSGVSTQVLAECTPALAGEGRKNQSLLVPNVLERAEERRSTLEGVSESRTGRGETEASGSPHRLAKGKQRSTPAWTWVRRAPARRSRPTRSAGTSRAQER